MKKDQSRIAVAVHGGAGDGHDPSTEEPRRLALGAALDAAWQVLSADGEGLVAVVAALRELENCEFLIAGFGSIPNENGEVYQDVALMRGDGRYISLMHVPRIRFPSALALDHLRESGSLCLAWTERRVSELDRRVLSDDGKLRERYGWVSSHDELVSPHAKRSAELLRAKRERWSDLVPKGTVGCVVRDAAGKVFAGTSTGGTSLKPDGRVGDSPMIGGGTYADDGVGAFSATGHGEGFLQSMVCGHVISSMRAELRRTPDAYLESRDSLLKNLVLSELRQMSARFPSSRGGALVMPASGAPVFAFNSLEMNAGLRYVTVSGEVIGGYGVSRGVG